METIPLFPLSTVLLPDGKMALQIFEPRYLDLISSCLKSNTGFGVVWLRQGSEVHRGDDVGESRFAQIGTYALISDWDSLPNGLLGITIQGSKKFRLVSSYQRSDNLNMAEVEWIADEPQIAVPEKAEELKTLLLQLLEHPHVVRLRLDNAINNASTLGCLLTQLLPVEEAVKFELLSLSDPLQRLQQLMDLLDQYLA